MEHLISSIMVQGTCLTPDTWDALCSLWNWAFWAAVFLGIVGSVACFLTRSRD